jgi:DNA-directed RNA polymerases I, II, and III subunit RPABC2
MSDDEYFQSDSESDDSDIEVIKPKVIKAPRYNDDDEDEDEEEVDVNDVVAQGFIEDEVVDDDEDPDYEEEDDDDDDVEEGDIEVKPAKQLGISKKEGGEDENEDDDDDEYDENYLQKFDADVNKNYITDFHPECLIHNYDEISKLSIVTRDETNIIVDPLHKTIPFLTKYEKARVLGQRAKQIECGAKPLVKIPENVIDGYIIAELELQQKRIPFIIKRPIPGGAFEYWNLKDLDIIAF